jgi:uncharacterized membrane protein
MLTTYLGVLVWQVIWHGLLPPPWGTHNIWLAVLACLPLLIPLRGLIRLSYRSMIWAGLLLMLYFTIGIMEIWTNPPQRPAAWLQVVLSAFYLFAFRKRNQSLA